MNSQQILYKLWSLHLRVNPNKVYDTTPNLNHFKSQLISTTCNYYISSEFSANFVQNLDSTYITKYKKPHQISTNPTTSNIKISTNSNAYISVNSQQILVTFWILNLMTNPSKVYDTTPILN